MHAAWTQLSVEVWGKIFTTLEGDVIWPDKKSFFDDNDSEDWEWFYSLRTVCRSFHEVFTKQPKLFRALALFRPPDSTESLQLIDWLNSHHSSIQNLSAQCGSPWVELVLTTLLHHQSPLRSVTLTNANTTAGCLLSRFESLTNCTLNLPTAAGAMSLSAFQALPQLDTLILEASQQRRVCAH